MDYESKYLKYKQKYLNFTSMKGGTRDLDEIINNVNLVHAMRINPSDIVTIKNNRFQRTIIDPVAPFYQSDNVLNFSDELTDQDYINLISGISRFNGYFHCNWGTLVQSHDLGNWSHVQMAIVTPLQISI